MEKEQKVTNRHILEQVSLSIPHIINRYLRTEEVSLFVADTKSEIFKDYDERKNDCWIKKGE